MNYYCYLTVNKAQIYDIRTELIYLKRKQRIGIGTYEITLKK